MAPSARFLCAAAGKELAVVHRNTGCVLLPLGTTPGLGPPRSWVVRGLQTILLIYADLWCRRSLRLWM